MKTLRELTGELVLIYHPYPINWSSDFIKKANLLPKTDIVKIWNDNELSYECRKTYQLKYLIIDEPMRGLYYAAKHGIPMLYKVCKKSLKKTIFNECLKRYAFMKEYQMEYEYLRYLQPCLFYLSQTARERLRTTPSYGRTTKDDEVLRCIEQDCRHTLFISSCVKTDTSSTAFMTTYMRLLRFSRRYT